MILIVAMAGNRVIDTITLNENGHYEYKLSTSPIYTPLRSKYSQWRVPSASDETDSGFYYTMTAELAWSIEANTDSWNYVLESLFVDGGRHLLYSLERYVHQRRYYVGRFKFTMSVSAEIEGSSSTIVTDSDLSLGTLQEGSFILMLDVYNQEVIPLLKAVYRGDEEPIRESLRVLDSYSRSGSDVSELPYGADYIIDKSSGSIYIYMMLASDTKPPLLRDVDVRADRYKVDSTYLEERFPIDSSSITFSNEQFYTFRSAIRKLFQNVRSVEWVNNWVDFLTQIFAEKDRGLMDDFLQRLREYV